MQRMILFYLAISATISLPAQAETPPGSSSDAATARARMLHVEGDALYEAHDYAAAHAAYMAASSLKKHYQIEGNLGDCEMKLGFYRDAAEHLASFIRGYPQDRPREPLERARALFSEARAHVGALRVTVPTVGAEVFLDGRSIGRAPIKEEVFVETGPHEIEARMGTAVAQRTVATRAGEQQAVTLEPSPPPAAATEPRAKGTPALVWVTGSATIAFAGVGLGLSLLSQSRADELGVVQQSIRQAAGELQSPCGTGTLYAEACNQASGLHREKRIMEGVAYGAFAAAGATFVASLVFAFSPRESPKARRTERSLVVIPMVGGFGVQGSF